MTDSIYREQILDHNKNPRNKGTLESPQFTYQDVNPLCGDHIHLSLKLNGDQVEAVGFEGEACAICKASASMMTVAVKGKSKADAEQMVQEFRDMTTGKLDAAGPHHLGRLTVFSGVSELPTRVKCAILPWHTLHAAFAGSDTASTE